VVSPQCHRLTCHIDHTVQRIRCRGAREGGRERRARAVSVGPSKAGDDMVGAREAFFVLSVCVGLVRILVSARDFRLLHVHTRRHASPGCTAFRAMGPSIHPFIHPWIYIKIPLCGYLHTAILSLVHVHVLVWVHECVRVCVRVWVGSCAFNNCGCGKQKACEFGRLNGTTDTWEKRYGRPWALSHLSDPHST